MKCTECPEYRECVKHSNLAIKRKSCPKAKVEKRLTNADRIRAMTDEELAELLSDDDRACPPKHQNCKKYVNSCKGCFLEWLQQPAEEKE